MKNQFFPAIWLLLSLLPPFPEAVGQTSPTCEEWLAGFQEASGRMSADSLLQYAKKATAACQAEFGARHKLYYEALFNEAEAILYSGRHASAKKSFEALADTLRARYGPTDTLCLMASLRVASAYREMGQYDSALALCKRVLPEVEKLEIEGQDLYAVVLNDMGFIYNRMGIFNRAEACLREALERLKGRKGPIEENYFISLLHLSFTLSEMGHFEEALRAAEQVSAWFLKTYGVNSPGYAIAQNIKSSVYSRLGQYSRAVELSEEAMRRSAQAFGEVHREHVLNIANLAILANDQGDYARSDSLCQVALELAEGTGFEPETKPVLLKSRGINATDAGDYGRAIALLEQSLSASLAVDNAPDPFTLHALSVPYYHQGEYRMADSLLRRAKSLLEERGMERSEEYLKIVQDLGWPQEALGRPDSALAFYKLADSLTHNLIRRNLLALGEYQQEVFKDKVKSVFETLPSFAVRHSTAYPETGGVLFDDALAMKSLVFENARKVYSALRKNKDQQVLDVYNRWIEAKMQLNYLQGQAAGPEKAGKMKEARFEIDSLGAVLFRQAASFREAAREIRWTDVRNSLKEEEALVEFIHFRYKNETWTDSTLYCALLLRPGYQYPRLVYLFEESQLASVLAYEGISPQETVSEIYAPPSGQGGTEGLAPSLYSLIWAPLEDHLRGVKKIYYSPTGLLHQVSFPAIARGPEVWLTDAFELEYAASSRDLVAGRRQLPGNAAAIQSAALFGGILYESDRQAAMLSREKLLAAQGLAGAGRGNRSKPQFLEGSLREMRLVDSLLAAHGVATDTFSGYDALEERFKLLSADTAQPSPGIIHLATHGYYYPDPSAARDSAAYNAPFKWAENPLFRSYLLMAGGEQAHFGAPPPGSYDDGILSAYEISTLDLSDTRLVALSACQTGLGDVRGSEGVYGLQRAFRLAGAQHLLVTLWQVDDDATAVFIRAFYAHWLSGQDIRAAFRKAQADVRKISKYRDPYFWAGFVLI
ncbi:MAG: CHAT domain-containing protein [Phaeodactylibacter sp.]|nr:CHAT domain-containing protein [Phaeodactylibacter sp.]